jgi:hypothetical protein
MSTARTTRVPTSGPLRCERGMAEGEGFEPPIPAGIPVFKTGAFDRSATPPVAAFCLLP